MYVLYPDDGLPIALFAANANARVPAIDQVAGGVSMPGFDDMNETGTPTCHVRIGVPSDKVCPTLYTVVFFSVFAKGEEETLP